LEIWWRLRLNYSDLYHRLLVAGIRALLATRKNCSAQMYEIEWAILPVKD